MLHIIAFQSVANILFNATLCSLLRKKCGFYLNQLGLFIQRNKLCVIYKPTVHFYVRECGYDPV
jgi:hypothetical protein